MKKKKKRECTKLPACLNKTKFRIVDEEQDSSPEEIRFWLKICVKNGDIVTLLHVATFHPFFQSPCFVPISVVPNFVLYVHSFTRPSATFHLHHFLHFLHSFIHSLYHQCLQLFSPKINAHNMHTFIDGSVESSRICMMILSEGQERPQAAPIES